MYRIVCYRRSWFWTRTCWYRYICSSEKYRCFDAIDDVSELAGMPHQFNSNNKQCVTFKLHILELQFKNLAPHFLWLDLFQMFHNKYYFQCSTLHWQSLMSDLPCILWKLKKYVNYCIVYFEYLKFAGISISLMVFIYCLFTIKPV